MLICAVNWGEVIVQVDRNQGRAAALQVQALLTKLGLEIISVTPERAERAALLKRDWKLGYADAFCAELAIGDPDSILITADFEFRAISALVKVEFLPDDHLGRTSLQ